MSGRRIDAAAAIVAVALAVGAGGCGAQTRSGPPTPPPSSDVPLTRAVCGTRAHPPARWKHVVWIWLENHSYGEVLGPRISAVGGETPFEAALGRACGVANGYYAIGHPSLMNYVAAVSGRTLGIERDCMPDECALDAPSLFEQIRRSGRTWRTYAESMAGNCQSTASSEYTPAHNPATYFDDLHADCERWDVPLGKTTRGALVSDLRAQRLPAFALVVPNLCDSAHSCGLTAADDWLRTWVPKLTATAAYRSGTTAIFVTWDEGAGGEEGRTCAKYDGSCHVATIVVSPSTRRGAFSTSYYTHYSLLRTTEQLLGLPPLGHAADPGTRSLRAELGLR